MLACSSLNVGCHISIGSWSLEYTGGWEQRVYACGRAEMKEWALAEMAAASMSAAVAPGMP